MQHGLRCMLAIAMEIMLGTNKEKGFLAGSLVLLGVFLGGALVMPFLVWFRSFRVGCGVVGRLSGFIMPGFGRRVVPPLGLTGGRTTDGPRKLGGAAASWERPMLVVAPQGAMSTQKREHPRMGCKVGLFFLVTISTVVVVLRCRRRRCLKVRLHVTSSPTVAT